MKRVIVMWALAASAADASLETIFNSLGSSTNVTHPGGYQDQAAGYYSGGGFAMRSKRTSFNPINVTLPSIKAGCGGIDAYMGSFSFMKADQLVKLLKSLGSQAASYAFQLALKTTAPQIENLLTQLRKMAMDMNNFMVEDCRMVESAFASILPKDSAMGQHACSDVLSHGGKEDWFGAKEKCKSHEAVKASTQDLKKANPDQLVGDYNLVWKAAQKSRVDDEEAAFIMTLTGTVISREERPASGGEAMYRTVFLEPSGSNAHHLNAYLKGGEVDLYRCDSDACLHPRLTKTPIAEATSLTFRVRRRIMDIEQKYRSKQAFSAEDTQFLNVISEKIPIYKYIQIASATGTYFLEEIVEVVALYVLLSHVEGISNDVLKWVEDLQSVQLADLDIKRFKESLQGLKSQLLVRLGALDQKIWSYQKKAKALEASLLSKEYLS